MHNQLYRQYLRVSKVLADPRNCILTYCTACLCKWSVRESPLNELMARSPTSPNLLPPMCLWNHGPLWLELRKVLEWFSKHFLHVPLLYPPEDPSGFSTSNILVPIVCCGRTSKFSNPSSLRIAMLKGDSARVLCAGLVQLRALLQVPRATWRSVSRLRISISPSSGYGAGAAGMLSGLLYIWVC